MIGKAKMWLAKGWKMSRGDITAVTLLTTLPFIIFWALWAPNPDDQFIFIGDVLVGAFPTRVYVHRMLMAGEMPLWNPYQLGGMPLLADVQVAVYYLPNLLLSAVFWGRDISYEGFEALIIAHYAIGGLWMYAYLRNLKLSPAAALVGAIAFEFNGFFIGHRGHYSMLSVVVWVPGILWALDRAWYAIGRQRAVKWTMVTALLISQMVMGGHPQLTFYSTIFIGSYFLYRWAGALKEHRAWWQASRRVKWSHPIVQFPLRIGTAGLLAGGISAIAVLPMVELLGRSLRSEPNYAFSVQYPLMPRNLINLFVPEFLDFSGTEFRIYAGIFTLVLALVAIILPRNAPKERWFFAITIPIAVVLAMGGFTALHGLLYRFMPGFSSVRVTARIFYFANISLAVLAAFGAQTLFSQLDRDDSNKLSAIVRNSRLIFLLVGAVAIGSYALLAWYFQPATDDFYFYESLFMQHTGGERYLLITQMVNELLLFVVLLMASMGVIWLKGNGRLQSTALMLTAIVLMTLDITTFATQHDAAKMPGIEDVAMIGFDVKLLEKWEVQDRDIMLDYLSHLPPTNRIDNGDEVLADNYSQVWETSFATGYNILDMQERFELLNQWPNLNQTTQWDLLNVHYIVTAPVQTDPPEVDASLVIDNSQGKIWQRAVTPEYARFSSSVRPVSTSMTINGYIAQTEGDPFVQPTIHLDSGNYADLFAEGWPEMSERGLYQIGSTDVSSPVDISVLAGGQGGYSAIIVNGETVTPDERGMIFAAIDSITGDVLYGTVFDTYLSETNSTQMANVINALPEGAIVALATYDEGTAKLNDAAYEAIASLGAKESLRDKFGQAYALIGVKGSSEGSALEAVGETAVTIDIGIGAAQPQPAAFNYHVVQHKQDEITLLAENSETGLLTISETVYPGWKAYVNGVETPILRANGLDRAIILPPPENGSPNEVTFLFAPTSVRLGGSITIMATFVALMLIGLSFMKLGSFARATTSTNLGVPVHQGAD